jgi:hypothetical protein
MSDAELGICGRIALLIGLAVSLCFAPAANAQPQPPQPVQRILPLDEALSWLPEDTETVMGANGVFPLTDPNVAEDPLTRPFLNELTVRTRTLPLALLLFHNGGLSSFVNGRPVVLALEGSRNFRAPAGLGAMRYEGCEIIMFGNGVALDWPEFRKGAASSATQFENWEGTEIAVFEEAWGKDKWTTLVAFPRSNVVLVATNRDYLRTVLSRMRKPSDSRALLDTLVEWRYVDTHAQVWGLRHYQSTKAELDPTSPFRGEAPANVPDSDAIGATFWFDPEQQAAVAAYVSLNSDPEQILARHLEPHSPPVADIQISGLELGIVQATAALSGLDSLYNVMFGIMALMGHGVYF